MEQLYLVGEPIFKPPFGKKHYAPVSQVDICQQVLRETQEPNIVLKRLQEEYLAIIWSLKKIGINFRIIYSHEDKIDKQVLGVCVEHVGCRLVGFHRDYFPPTVAYPRDFVTVLPELILVNSQIAGVKVREKDNCRILSSPYGEGGRALTREKTMLACERLVLEDKHSSEPKGLQEIRQAGIKIALLPLPLSIAFSISGVEKRAFFNDHLDRIGCLIRGKDRGLHFVVDPQIYTADWKGYRQATSWVRRSPGDTIKRIKQDCEPLEIEVHCPKKLKVPYSLNLIQFLDSQVLMTSGDDSIVEVVSEIVGEDKIAQTPIPIRFFPVWAYAGIRCLVNKAPMPLLKPKASV